MLHLGVDSYGWEGQKFNRHTELIDRLLVCAGSENVFCFENVSLTAAL